MIVTVIRTDEDCKTAGTGAVEQVEWPADLRLPVRGDLITTAGSIGEVVQVSLNLTGTYHQIWIQSLGGR